MKTFDKQLLKTNLSKIDAFKAMNTNKGKGAKELVGQSFKLKGYVLYLTRVSEIDEITGEAMQTSETTNLVLLTDTGEYIGTNSSVMIRSLRTILDMFTDEELSDLDFTVTQGTSKNGYKFNDLEIA